MIKTIIVGANGFVAKHLKDSPLLNQHELYCFTSKRVRKSNFFLVNPSDRITTQKLIAKIRPNVIYHLAGTTSTDSNISRTINFEYCKNIINGIQSSKLTGITKLIVFGSASEYGYLNQHELPVHENSATKPFSLYGLNKLAQTNLVLKWRRECSGQAVILRPFTILGAGMPPHLAIGNFETQISNIVTKKSQPILSTGNLNSYRDYIDVRDVVKIMLQVANEPAANGEIINICSGLPVKIGDILQYMLKSIDMPIAIHSIQNEFRENDMPIHYGSNKKLKSLIKVNELINWQRSIDEIIQNIQELK